MIESGVRVKMDQEVSRLLEPTEYWKPQVIGHLRFVKSLEHVFVKGAINAHILVQDGNSTQSSLRSIAFCCCPSGLGLKFLLRTREPHNLIHSARTTLAISVLMR